ncbi:MAG: putative Ig domain-containing protein [Gammaproteobacteria bacterium]
MGQKHALRAARTSVLAFAFLASSASLLQAATPTISGSPATSTTVGASYSFTPSAKDADGNKLSFIVARKPAWAAFSTSTGRLSGTPNDARAWSDIVISVSDGNSMRSLPAFTLLVKPGSGSGSNAAPKISATPRTSVTVGTAYSFQPTASDANNDKLTFSIANKPSWASFSTSTGKLAGTPSSSNVGTTKSIVIKVSDGKASASLGAFSLSVTTTQVASRAVTVDWDPPLRNVDGSTLTNLAGYRIHYGQSASSLTKTVNIATAGVTRYLVENLSPGSWHFAVRSYNSAGIESELSQVVGTTLK